MTKAARESAEVERVREWMDRGAVFVFGSNLRGVHGAGAARVAAREYGAVMGEGVGYFGRSYAIPTKGYDIKTRPLPAIASSVAEFLRFAEQNPLLTFAVTKIGCGLAGYPESAIAPLFYTAPVNCKLPNGWIRAERGTRGSEA